MGREILLYLIMYRKYVRKWWLLKRNRIICPKSNCKWAIFALKIDLFKLSERNWNFSKICLKKWKFSENLPWKIEIFWKFSWKRWIFLKIPWKNRNFSEICLEKSTLCWPGSTTPSFQTRLTPLSSTPIRAPTHPLFLFQVLYPCRLFLEMNCSAYSYNVKVTDCSYGKNLAYVYQQRGPICV